MSQHTELRLELTKNLKWNGLLGVWLIKHHELIGLIERAADALQALEPDDSGIVPDSDKVICPGCSHQFTAIPGNVQARLQALERVPMTEEADELLRKWNLDPDLYRTDSGALNHMKIAAALKHPDDYPHTAQTAVKSESLAQAAQALAQPPSEGKTIEALAPTEAALRDVVRQSEDMGLYDADFQTGRAGSKP